MKYSNTWSALFLVAAATLAGCDPATETAPPPDATNIVVIGNSITKRGPRPDLGWHGDYGMAASSEATDFAHVLADLAGLPVSAQNFSALEMSPTTSPIEIPSRTAGVNADSLVVIEMGDNVPLSDLTGFESRLNLLLDAVSGASVRVCTGTWWYRASVDAVIQRVCQAHGAHFVFIGDIWTDPANRDKLDGPQFDEYFVNEHPHDWSMAEIAERIFDVSRLQPL